MKQITKNKGRQKGQPLSNTTTTSAKLGPYGWHSLNELITKIAAGIMYPEIPSPGEDDCNFHSIQFSNEIDIYLGYLDSLSSWCRFAGRDFNGISAMCDRNAEMIGADVKSRIKYTLHSRKVLARLATEWLATNWPTPPKPISSISQSPASRGICESLQELDHCINSCTNEDDADCPFPDQMTESESLLDHAHELAQLKKFSEIANVLTPVPIDTFRAITYAKYFSLPRCFDLLGMDVVVAEGKEPYRQLEAPVDDPRITPDCKLIEWQGKRITLGQKKNCRIVLAYVFEQAAKGILEFQWSDVCMALPKWRYKTEIAENSRLRHEVFKNCKSDFDHLIETVNLTTEEFRVKIPVPPNWKAAGL